MSLKPARTVSYLFFVILCAYLLYRANLATVREAGEVISAKNQNKIIFLSPMDNEILSVTPPPFIWAGVKDAEEYSIQISSAMDFPRSQTETYEHIKRTAFVPTQLLAAGLWYWRLGVNKGGVCQFGAVHSFRISPQAVKLPFPQWQSLLSRIPRERPRLFFPGERLTQARKWANTELKPALDTLEKTCLAKVGQELVKEPGKRPKDNTEGAWSIQVIETTRPPMDLMENCALLYLLRGNQRLGQEARRLLLHFFSWDPNGTTSLLSYDEPAMWMMMRGTRAYDWTYSLFTTQERQQIEGVMRIRAQQFLSKLESLPFENSPYNSHAGRLPGFLGECALSFIHEWPEASQWLDYATLLYYTSYPAWGGKDGGWQEGPHYWNDYMNFALHFVIALHHATGVNLIQKPFFTNTPNFALYTAPPYRQHSPFGDNQAVQTASFGEVMYAFASLTQNPYFQWYAQESQNTVGGSLLSIATYNPGLEARHPQELPQSRVFYDVGLAALHTALGEKDKDIYFLLRSSPYGSISHGHADQNAFVIEAFGYGLAIATGYYPWYSSPHHHLWTRATRAVNSILVNGEGQTTRSWDAVGKITEFFSDRQYDYIESEASAAYMGRLQRFRRHVLHLRPGIFVMFDDVKAPVPSQFQWLLHAYQRMQIDPINKYLYIQNGTAAMKVFLLLPAQLSFNQTDSYTPSPESPAHEWQNTWHLTAETTTPANHIQFLSVFLVHRVGQENQLPEVQLVQGTGAIGVRLIGSDGQNDIVVFRVDPALPTTSCGGIQSAANVYAQGLSKEKHITRHFELPNAPKK